MAGSKEGEAPNHAVAEEKQSRRGIPRIGGIRSRLLIAFVPIVLLAAFAISAVTVVLGSTDARQRVVGQLESVATLKEAEITSWVSGLAVNLNIAISDPEVLNSVSVLTEGSAAEEDLNAAYALVLERFEWAAETLELFQEIFLMDLEGRLLLSTDPAHEGEVHSIYDYFTEGMKGYHIQSPTYSLSLGELIVVASAPVRDDGTLLGVVAGRASLASLNEIMLERAGLGDTGETYLVGSNYRLLTSLREDGYTIPETYIASEGAYAAISNRTDGSDTYVNYGGKSVIGVYRWIPELGVALLAEQQETEALHATVVVLMTVGGVAIGSVALAVVVAILITRSISRPLGNLADTAKRIAAGDLELTAKVEGADEVGVVAKAFNRMTTQLRQNLRDLERRTGQLKAINEMGRQISAMLQLESLLPQVAVSLRETFRYHAVRIVLIDQDSGAFVVKASSVANAGTPDQGSAEVLSSEIVGLAAETGEPQVTGDVCREGSCVAAEARAGKMAELAVPIKIAGRTVGVLHIESVQAHPFDDVDLATATTLSDQLAIALENARLYEEAQQLATTQERQRLARELHDAVTQTLFSASLVAEVLPRLWEKDPAEGRRRLEEIRQLTRGALAEMRMLLLELRPEVLAETGLADLLERLKEATTARAKLPIFLSIEGRCTVPPDVQVAFYRIAQEALNNVVKHSRATEVKIHLSCDGESAELSISDNGTGFDTVRSTGHLGLRIMGERAESCDASLRVESELGNGTRVTVIWPRVVLKET